MISRYLPVLLLGLLGGTPTAYSQATPGLTLVLNADIAAVSNPRIPSLTIGRYLPETTLDNLLRTIGITDFPHVDFRRQGVKLLKMVIDATNNYVYVLYKWPIPGSGQHDATRIIGFRIDNNELVAMFSPVDAGEDAVDFVTGQQGSTQYIYVARSYWDRSPFPESRTHIRTFLIRKDGSLTAVGNDVIVDPNRGLQNIVMTTVITPAKNGFLYFAHHEFGTNSSTIVIYRLRNDGVPENPRRSSARPFVTSMAPHRQGSHVYVANTQYPHTGDVGLIAVYGINPTTGELGQPLQEVRGIISTHPPDNPPLTAYQIVVDDYNHLYAYFNSAGYPRFGTMIPYDIQPDGRIVARMRTRDTPVHFTPYSAYFGTSDDRIVQIAVDYSGRSVYIISNLNSDIWDVRRDFFSPPCSPTDPPCDEEPLAMYYFDWFHRYSTPTVRRPISIVTTRKIQ